MDLRKKKTDWEMTPSGASNTSMLTENKQNISTPKPPNKMEKLKHSKNWESTERKTTLKQMLTIETPSYEPNFYLSTDGI